MWGQPISRHSAQMAVVVGGALGKWQAPGTLQILVGRKLSVVPYPRKKARLKVNTAQLYAHICEGINIIKVACLRALF